MKPSPVEEGSDVAGEGPGGPVMVPDDTVGAPNCIMTVSDYTTEEQGCIEVAQDPTAARVAQLVALEEGQVAPFFSPGPAGQR